MLDEANATTDEDESAPDGAASNISRKVEIRQTLAYFKQSDQSIDEE
jgi:hypothetical protein